MRILVLGGKGQLGNELTKVFRENKHIVYSFSSSELDVTDFKRIKVKIKKISPDIVINATAYHVLPQCEENPEKSFQINALAIKNLAEICQDLNKTFITYSTDYVFDGLKGKPYKEDDIPNPLQVYGVSKVAGEQFAINYNRKTYVIRTCGVYAGKTGSKSKKGNFVVNILKEMEGKKMLEVASEQIVSPTYAADLSQATILLLKKRAPFGIYHLINSGYCSWAEFAAFIAKQKGYKTKVIPVDRKGGQGKLKRPIFSALKNSKAAKLEIVLPPWKDAVRRYLATF